MPGTWQGPFCSGAPAIFASVAARLGARVALAGSVGDDAFGRYLRERLRRDGVDTAVLTEAAGRPTAVAMVAYDSSGGRDFFFSVRGSAAEAIDVAAAERAAREADWIHVSGSSIGFGDSSPPPSSDGRRRAGSRRAALARPEPAPRLAAGGARADRAARPAGEPRVPLARRARRRSG